MPKSVLIDSCIWFDLLESKEETVKFYDTLNRESAVFIVPYPIATINVKDFVDVCAFRNTEIIYP